MKRGFPGKQAGERASVVALEALLTQARTLDHFTPESLVRSYGVPLAVADKMLSDARRRRVLA
jgi:hypothetical protein